MVGLRQVYFVVARVEGMVGKYEVAFEHITVFQAGVPVRRIGCTRLHPNQRGQVSCGGVAE
jgi:hypothetical protein